MIENEIAKIVVDAAIEVHRTLGGPELLEAQRLCELRLALVINFGERQVRQGIRRVPNGLRQ